MTRDGRGPLGHVDGAVDTDAAVEGAGGAAGVRRLVLEGVGPGRLPAAVRACLPPGARGSSALVKAKARPGRRVTAYYRLAVAGDPLVSRCAAVTWSASRDGRLDARGDAADREDEVRLQEEAGRRGLLLPFVRLSGTDARKRRKVLISPVDADFPQLVRLCDLQHVARVLASGGLPVDVLREEALRYRPRQRHVLRWVQRQNGLPVLYAKLYRPGQAPPAGRLDEVVPRLAAAPGQPDLARPTLDLTGDGALVWQAAAGTPLSELLVADGRGDPGLPAALRAAGAALRALHDVPASAAPLLPTHDLARELATVTSAGSHLRALHPDAAAAADAVVAAVRSAAGDLPSEPPAVVHGDVKAEHILVGRSGVSLVDLDRCAVADPGLDVAKLLADLRWRLSGWGETAVTRAQQALLSGYGDHRGERLARARLFEALFLVRIAARRVPLADPDWEAAVSSLLAEAERLLAHRRTEGAP